MKNLENNLIDPVIQMEEPNDSIPIFTGTFSLDTGQVKVEVEGSIVFRWFPHSSSYFEGKIKNDQGTILELFSYEDEFIAEVNGSEAGKVIILNRSFDSIVHGNFIYIEGAFSGYVVLGEKTVPVSKIAFSIPNLRRFRGTFVNKTESNGASFSGDNRLRLENDEFLINIDKLLDFDKNFQVLRKRGGYLVNYAGELFPKKGCVTHDKVKGILYCLSTFLSILNGRRVSAHFIHGIHEGEVIWKDFTNYFIDDYKGVRSWPSPYTIEGINEMWIGFSTLWKCQEDQDFLTSVTHWYLEANSNNGFAEGSIIMAQTALELLYNWWIHERKGLIQGKDAEGISASNKLRLLLSQLDVEPSVPDGLTHLKEFVKENKNKLKIIDAAEAIVFIRNAIVHSQVEKRRKLSEIPGQVKWEALQLSIWYIELALLKILKYNGKYNNRSIPVSNFYETEDTVPWAKINSL